MKSNIEEVSKKWIATHEAFNRYNQQEFLDDFVKTDFALLTAFVKEGGSLPPEMLEIAFLWFRAKLIEQYKSQYQLVCN